MEDDYEKTEHWKRLTILSSIVLFSSTIVLMIWVISIYGDREQSDIFNQRLGFTTRITIFLGAVTTAFGAIWARYQTANQTRIQTAALDRQSSQLALQMTQNDTKLLADGAALIADPATSKQTAGLAILQQLVNQRSQLLTPAIRVAALQLELNGKDGLDKPICRRIASFLQGVNERDFPKDIVLRIEFADLHNNIELIDRVRSVQFVGGTFDPEALVEFTGPPSYSFDKSIIYGIYYNGFPIIKNCTLIGCEIQSGSLEFFRNNKFYGCNFSFCKIWLKNGTYEQVRIRGCGNIYSVGAPPVIEMDRVSAENSYGVEWADLNDITSVAIYTDRDGRVEEYRPMR